MKKRAYELYQVTADYRRFDQKLNMTCRSKWDWHDFSSNARKNRESRMLQGAAGYGLRDLALWQAAHANLIIAGSGLHLPNRGHTSWSKVAGTMPVGMGRLEIAPETLRSMVDKVARLFGADLVGVAKLDRRWVYSRYYDEETEESYPILFSDELEGEYLAPTVLEDRTQVIPKEMDRAVVMLVNMDEVGIDTAPTLTHRATVRLAYARLGFLALGLAEFIRGLGYSAMPMINDTALNVPLAIDAGLGQLGSHGLLINPSFGPRCRICKVLTDLPLQEDYPIDFGVTAFCEACKKCAQHCPVEAISSDERNRQALTVSSNPGALKWGFDAEKCRKYQMTVGSNCGICIRVCPFNKSRHWIHGVVRWSIRTFPAINPFIVKMDDVFGYGVYKNPEDHFWS